MSSLYSVRRLADVHVRGHVSHMLMSVSFSKTGRQALEKWEMQYQNIAVCAQHVAILDSNIRFADLAGSLLAGSAFKWCTVGPLPIDCPLTAHQLPIINYCVTTPGHASHENTTIM